MPFPNPRLFQKKANWPVALAVEALGPLLRAWAGGMTGRPTPAREWRKVLILGADHLGDVLYRSASLGALKAGMPECEFHYLTAPGSAAVLAGNAALAGVLPWARSESPLDLAAEHLAALKAMRFDAAVCTSTGRYWPELLLALRLGIPNRAGCIDKGFSGWVTRPILIRRPQPFAGYFRDFVADLTGLRPDWPLRPVIHADEGDEAEADALWTRLGLDRYPHVTAGFMTSRQPTRIWPSGRFGEALRALRRRRDTHILLCGAAADEEILAGVNRDCGLEAEIIAGGLGVRALCCFLRRCSAVLCPDSGPRHIANAAGAPVFFVRNVWSDAVETGAYVDTETDLCGQPHDGERGDGAALLAAIDPERVAEIIAGAGRGGPRAVPPVKAAE